MALGFGSTYGVGTSDRLSLSLTSSAQWSFACRYFRNGTGGGGVGRIFDCNSTNSGFGLLFYDNANSRFQLTRSTSGTAGVWTWTTGNGTGAWNALVITQDGISAPTVYVNGSAVTVTQQTAPTGSAAASTLDHFFGNRLGADRVFDGMLAELTFWTVVLTAEEAAALSVYAPHLVRPASIRQAMPFVRSNQTRTGVAWATAVGTAVQPHPRIIYSFRHPIYVPAATGGGSTYNDDVSFAAAAALTPAATASAAAAFSLAASAALTPGAASTASAALAYAAAAAFSPTATVGASASTSYSATAGLTPTGAATGTATLGFSATAALSPAVTCVASIASAFQALTALVFSDGSTQNVSESVGFSATAAHQMTAAAVVTAVQTYLASAGLTHAPTATAGATLAYQVQAALTHAPTAQAQAALTLAVAATLAMQAAADGDISYDVLRVAAETLRAALATGETLRAADAIDETLRPARVTGETLH